MSADGISVPVLCLLCLGRDADPLWSALYLTSGLVYTVKMGHVQNAVFMLWPELSHPQ